MFTFYLRRSHGLTGWPEFQRGEAKSPAPRTFAGAPIVGVPSRVGGEMNEFKVGDVVVLKAAPERFQVVSEVEDSTVVTRGCIAADWRRYRCDEVRHPTRDEAVKGAQRLSGGWWVTSDMEDTHVRLRSGEIDAVCYVDGSWGINDGYVAEGEEWSREAGVAAASLAIIRGIILGEIAAPQPAPVTEDEDATLAQMGMDVEEGARKTSGSASAWATLGNKPTDMVRLTEEIDPALMASGPVVTAADPVVTALLRLIAEGEKVASVTLTDGRVLRPVVRWEVGDE